MDAEWMTSPSGRRVLVHWADPRPAWLWSADGNQLLWRNPAVRYFGGKLKKSGLKLAPDAAPIKGQVTRLMRLGSEGRSSLSRVAFLSGDKPISTTCICTPLELPGKGAALLIVGVDPIASDLLATATEPEEANHELLPPGTGYLLIDDSGRLAAGSTTALAAMAPRFEAGDLPDVEMGESAEVETATGRMPVTRLKASEKGASVLLFGGIEPIPEPEPVPEVDDAPWPEAMQPMLPLGLETVPRTQDDEDIGYRSEDDEKPPDDQWVRPSELPQPPSQSLSSLFDRLANDAELYAGLEPATPDEPLVEPVDTIGALIEYDEPEADAEAQAEATPVIGAEPEAKAVPVLEAEDVAAPVVAEEEPEAAAAAVEEEEAELEIEAGSAVLYRVTARTIEAVEEAEVRAVEPQPPQPDFETVERVSRYNFDELSRILTDRVAAEAPPPVVVQPPKPPAPVQPQGELVNLTGETFILNRLPLGIMVFRDQQVLFANRAITEMVGYASVEDLRNAGLSAIFPIAGPQEAGPINHLVQRDGTLLPVTARLQSISWQGRPALMLSASATEVRTGHETAVRHFAELLADSREDGFIELNRAGVVTMASARALAILARSEQQVSGKPLSGLIDGGDGRALQEFLERPARFAETARPTLVIRGAEPNSSILLFGQGQAGVITGYFGLVRRAETAATPAVIDEPIEPALLARLSRGVRRPLNTIIGFADMIRSAALGTGSTERYAEYARDIRTAGQEIASLVDELDDYARLRDGRYAPRLTDIDLKSLLEICAARVRTQAGVARVLVRSAISERLPHVRADRGTLGQAVLNLLASAIEQSPAGGTVILSAQVGDDGSIAINVRDSGHPETDPGERFVVFREGTSRDGEVTGPARSSVGLALTRSLAAVNACALSIDPAGSNGTLFSLTIPATAVAGGRAAAAD